MSIYTDGPPLAYGATELNFGCKSKFTYSHVSLLRIAPNDNVFMHSTCNWFPCKDGKF